jgi:hypothetical protein
VFAPTESPTSATAAPSAEPTSAYPTVKPTTLAPTFYPTTTSFPTAEPTTAAPSISFTPTLLADLLVATKTESNGDSLDSSQVAGIAVGTIAGVGLIAFALFSYFGGGWSSLLGNNYNRVFNTKKVFVEESGIVTN